MANAIYRRQTVLDSWPLSTSGLIGTISTPPTARSLSTPHTLLSPSRSQSSVILSFFGEVSMLRRSSGIGLGKHVFIEAGSIDVLRWRALDAPEVDVSHVFTTRRRRSELRSPSTTCETPNLTSVYCLSSRR